MVFCRSFLSHEEAPAFLHRSSNELLGLIGQRIPLREETLGEKKTRTGPTNTNIVRKYEVTSPWERLLLVRSCCEREQAI